MTYPPLLQDSCPKTYAPRHMPAACSPLAHCFGFCAYALLTQVCCAPINGSAVPCVVLTDEAVKPLCTPGGECTLATPCLYKLAEVRNKNQMLATSQMAIGALSGVEVVVHVVRQWWFRSASDKKAMLLKKDRSNAFNEAEPSICLKVCRRRMPGCARLAECCYGDEVNLVHQGRIT